MTPDFISWWDTFGKFHYQEAEIRTPIDAARLGWEAASQSAPSDKDAFIDCLPEYRRGSESGYVRGLEDVSDYLRTAYRTYKPAADILDGLDEHIRALKAAHAAQINAAPQARIDTAGTATPEKGQGQTKPVVAAPFHDNGDYEWIHHTLRNVSALAIVRGEKAAWNEPSNIAYTVCENIAEGINNLLEGRE